MIALALAAASLQFGLHLQFAFAGAIANEKNGCEVAPRTPAEIAALVGSTGGSGPDSERSGGQYHDSIPSGLAADEKTTDEISEVLNEVVNCVNASDNLRLFSLYTDHAIYAQGPFSLGTVLEQTNATPEPRPANEAVSIDTIHSIDILPGAFVAAIVTLTGLEDTEPTPGVTYVFIFAMTSDGWRIDDQYDRIAPADSTEPVYVAELVP